ncbi:hypothetical protein Hanom_Chr11g01002361 [Helianthus anomalus]
MNGGGREDELWRDVPFRQDNVRTKENKEPERDFAKFFISNLPNVCTLWEDSKKWSTPTSPGKETKKIHGVPVHLAENWVFDYVAGQYGSVVHLSQMDAEYDNFSMECDGILVRDKEIINESLTIKWKNKCFKLWIHKENGDWEPDSLGEV